jgi:hypothetical protein
MMKQINIGHHGMSIVLIKHQPFQLRERILSSELSSSRERICLFFVFFFSTFVCRLWSNSMLSTCDKLCSVLSTCDTLCFM